MFVACLDGVEVMVMGRGPVLEGWREVWCTMRWLLCRSSSMSVTKERHLLASDFGLFIQVQPHDTAEKTIAY